jgi:O-antigen/teichoic acid export membrane protein
VSQYRRNSILNLIFNYSNIVFNLITGIFLVPFYLRKIPLDAYGSFLAAVALAALIGLLEFGLSMVLTQRLARSYARSDWTDFRQLTYNGLVAATLLAAATCLLTLSISPWVPALTNTVTTHASDLSSAFLLLGIAAASNIYLNLFGSIFQALLKAGTLGAINLLAAFIGILTVIVGFSWYGTLTAIAAGTIVRMGCATVLLMGAALLTLRKIALLPQRAPIRQTVQLLRACVPIFIGGVAKSVAENAQNLLLANAVSPSAIAVLALTQKALQVCNMVLAPIGSSIYSNLTQIKEKTDSLYFSSLLGISIRGHFLVSVLLVATALTFNEPFVALWVGAEKFGGLGLSILLGVAMLLVTRFSFFSFLIYSTGEFKKPLLLETSYSVAKITLLLALIHPLGLYAVPLADVIAGIVFLYSLSTRLMAPHVRISTFGAGLYINGWIEFVVLMAIGGAAMAWLPPIHGWSTLAASIAAYVVLATTVALAINVRFLNACSDFLRRKSVTTQ